MSVVEADLDADFALPAVLGLSDAPLAQGTVGVGLAGLEADISHTGVPGVTAGPNTAVPCSTSHGCPHTAVLRVRGAVTGDTWDTRG